MAGSSTPSGLALVGGEPQLLVADLGTMPYEEALALQRLAARARIAGGFQDDLLLLVEHPPVVTQGRASKVGHLLASEQEMYERGVELHEVERGGDVTFHGPGQLVGYAIFDLKRHRQDLHWYLRQVEEALIQALSALGIAAGRNAGFTGVWSDGRKLASIGVHARDWVTWHGFALNVSTDLSYFDLIVPCGIEAVEMTTVSRELQRTGVALPADLAPRVRDGVVRAFAGVFALEPVALDLVELERVAATTIPA